jgi:molybdopterin/thiamine biosynthesis adenylyltransferase
MEESLRFSRIHDAGVDISQIQQTCVLIKVGDVRAATLWYHPVFPLVRGLAALGFDIFICGAQEYLEDLDKLIGAECAKVIQFPGPWLNADLAFAVTPDADIIVDLSNEILEESFCVEISSARSCPCISVMWGNCWVAVSQSAISREDLGQISSFDKTRGLMPSPISRLAAGLALQEVVIIAGNMNLVAHLEKTVFFNAAAEDRTSARINQPWKPVPLRNSVVDLIGAGGIGSVALESLSPMLDETSKVFIFDYDCVGPENLAVQPLFSVDDVGRPKAITLAEKLKLIYPSLKIQPMVMPYQQRPTSSSKPSVRILCPDNWRVRKFANDLSIQDGVPLAEAGSSPLVAKQHTYVRGLTACLEHRINLLAEKDYAEERPDSCSQNTAPTLPGINLIISSVLVIETLKALRPSGFGEPSKGSVIYDARFPQRFGILDLRQPCKHC